MSLPTIPEESWENMAEQKTPRATPRRLSPEAEEFVQKAPQPLKLNAEEFVPFNQRQPIPQRISRNDNTNTNLENARFKIQHQMRLMNRNKNEVKNIETLRARLHNIGTSNTRGNYNKKMQRYLRAKAAAIPLENIERNLIRSRNTHKSPKSRKSRKTRKSRKLL